MTSLSIRFAVIALAASFATDALAQSTDWYVVPSIIWNDDDEERAIDDSLSGGQIVVGRNVSQHISIEGLLGYSPIEAWCVAGDCYPDQNHLDFSAHMLAFANRDALFSPYFFIGVGYLGVDADEGPQFVANTGSDSRPTGSYGIGVNWRMGQSDYSIRTEYRSRVAFGNPNNLDDRLWTIGLQFDFGTAADPVDPTNETVDTDGDGVLDMWDACDNTPSGVAVTSRGCPIVNIDRDDDEDHIQNSVDECPNTPRTVPVDPRGCSLDSDGDGVTTNIDRCPATRSGVEVDALGCEVNHDNDGDGVLNEDDSCLSTKSGARIDSTGCEIVDVISLPGVNFETGFDMLLPDTEYLLETAAATLIRYPEMYIEVAGHTDNVGNDVSNAGLSERRAVTVRDLLIRYGVAEDRLTFKGYGEALPIADNETAEGRATNRRVELRLVNR